MSDESLAELPAASPISFLDTEGKLNDQQGPYTHPPTDLVVEAYRKMVLGRAFNNQALTLARQGRLGAYPSSLGQEACQISAALALAETDWLFPTYREMVALLTRGIDPLQLLDPMRGLSHGGYDPTRYRTAPACTPLATHCLHAAGFVHGERYQGRDTIALVCVGDGATSEGDFHEALNFAAVFNTPVVFFVQNNGYAISTPFQQQTATPALAYRGVGYGVRAEQVDGNDVVAVLAVLDKAVRHARAGNGPFLVEAHTYRMEGHTTNDDPTRYRDKTEVAKWHAKDPLIRIRKYLLATDTIDEDFVRKAHNEADIFIEDLRQRFSVEPTINPHALLDNVYATLTPQLREQRRQLSAELAAEKIVQ